MKSIFSYLYTFFSILLFSQNDGTLDNSFGNSGYVKYNSQAYGTCMELDSNQNLIVGTYNYSQTFKFYKFSQSGQLDISFGINGEAVVNLGGQDALLNDMKLQSDNKIVAVGYWKDSTNRSDFVVVRLNANGSLDTSFNGTGKLTIAFGTGEDVAESVVLQPDGKIVVAGYSFTGAYRDFAVARINSNGTLDTTFSEDGKVTTDLLGNDDYAKAIAINKDGKIGVAGYSYGSSAADFAIVRYNANGSLDTTFSGDGKLVITLGANNDNAIAIAFQNDNKIVVGGTYFSSNSARDDFAIVRLNVNGSLDTSFNGDGIFSTSIGTSDDTPRAMKLQNDGKILLVGDVRSGSYTDIGLIRVTTSGNLDTTFGTGGISRQAYGNGSVMYDIEISNSGNIYLCGHSDYDILLARFGDPLLSVASNTSKELTVYPNPVKNILKISQTVDKVELFALDGKLIRTDANIDKLDFSNVSKGVYNLKITLNGQKGIIVKKIIKN